MPGLAIEETTAMAIDTGTRQADLLLGTADPDVFFGLAGNDTIIGRDDNDTIFSGAGNDFINGDKNFNYPLPDPDGSVEQGGPTWSSSQSKPGSSLIFGGAGKDEVYAGYGSNTVFGGAGDDSMFGWGFIPVNEPRTLEGRTSYLYGGAGRDSIEGGRANDFLCGGQGNDTLQGNQGADTLTGGSGRDLFVFGRVEFNPDTGVGEGQRDIITDFQHGPDKIDLTRYSNTFVFLGIKEFEASFDLQVRYEIVGGNTIIQINAPYQFDPENPEPTVPSGPSQEIELQGVHRLVASDFIMPPGFGDYVLNA